MRTSLVFAFPCFVWFFTNRLMRHLLNNFIARGPVLLRITRQAGSSCASKARTRFLTGQATVSFILLVSGVILQIAIAGSIVTYFLSSSRFNERLAVRSFVAADAGFKDAVVHIARDLNFAQSGNMTYSMTVGGDTATVTVSRSTDVANDIYVYTISSIGTAFSRQKKLVGTVLTHQNTGLIELKSLTEESVN